MREDAGELGVDPGRIFLMGHSAGGAHVGSYAYGADCRPSFAPETIAINFDERDQSRRKNKEINSSDLSAAAHNGLVAGSSPAGPPIKSNSYAPRFSWSILSTNRTTNHDDQMELINPWVPHANWRNESDPPITILALYLEAGWLVRGSGNHSAWRPFNRQSAMVDSRMRTLATKIAGTIAEATTPTAEEDLEADILCLLQQVLAANSSADLAPIAVRPVDHRIRKAIGLMRADPRKSQCLDDVAQSVGLSRFRFFEQFSASMGMTPSVFSDTLRVEYAIEQLIGSDRSASDIAFDLGFSAPGHFSGSSKTRSTLRRANTAELRSTHTPNAGASKL